MRGYADDLPLMTWLTDYIWPAERKILSGEFVYNSTLLSIAESIRSGVTCINDMYFFAFDTKRAFEKAGIRGVVGFGVLENFNKAFKAADKFEETELVSLSICPHALYTVPFDIMKQCCSYAQKRNILLHTHLAETLDEERQILERYNKRPVELMYETGAFDINSVFAHCVHVNDDDIKIMADEAICKTVSAERAVASILNALWNLDTVLISPIIDKSLLLHTPSVPIDIFIPASSIFFTGEKPLASFKLLSIQWDTFTFLSAIIFISYHVGVGCKRTRKQVLTFSIE